MYVGSKKEILLNKKKIFFFIIKSITAHVTQWRDAPMVWLSYSCVEVILIKVKVFSCAFLKV